ncbi:hypothetical protein C6P40_003323, partial [Pichia californica]
QHQQQFDQFTSINNNVLTVKPLRKRAFSKRSKTGCLTCRERRIKCDETKSICKNCHKSKRICKYPKIENTKLTENNNKQVKKVCKVKTTTKKTKKSIDFKNSDSNKSLISEISYSNLHIDDDNSPILKLPRDQNHIPYILNYNPVIVPRQQINNSLDKRYILPPVNSVNNETNSQQLQILPQSYEQQQPLLPPLPMPRKSSSSIYTYDNNLRNGINTSSISSVSTGVGNSRNSMSGSNSSSLVSNDLSNQYFYLLKYRNPGIQSINVNNNNHHYNNNNNNNNNSDISLSLPRQQSHLPLLKNSDPNNYYQQPLVYFNFLDNINNGINGLSVTNAFTENINTTNKTINNNTTTTTTTTTTATIRNNKYNNINHNIDNTNPK